MRANYKTTNYNVHVHVITVAAHSLVGSIISRCSGNKTGLEKMAEIEPNSFVNDLLSHICLASSSRHNNIREKFPVLTVF